MPILTEANRKWWTLGAMCFALFMVMLDNTVVNIALPAIKSDFGASISGLSWAVNAYTLSFAVLLVTGGRLGDVFGRKRMFLAGPRRVHARVDRRGALAVDRAADLLACRPGRRRRVPDAGLALDPDRRLPRP